MYTQSNDNQYLVLTAIAKLFLQSISTQYWLQTILLKKTIVWSYKVWTHIWQVSPEYESINRVTRLFYFMYNKFTFFTMYYWNYVVICNTHYVSTPLLRRIASQIMAFSLKPELHCPEKKPSFSSNSEQYQLRDIAKIRKSNVYFRFTAFNNG